MPFDYSPLAELAAGLLLEFGQTVTLSRTVPGSYDPVTGTTTGDVEQAQTARAALLDYSLQESGAKFADGSMIRTGDKKCLIEAHGLAWAPDETTILTDATGVAWQLERIQTVAPSGAAVLHKANGTR